MNELTIWAMKSYSNTYVQFLFRDLDREMLEYDPDFTYYENEMNNIVRDCIEGSLVFYDSGAEDYAEADDEMCGLNCPLYIELRYLDGCVKIIKRSP